MALINRANMTEVRAALESLQHAEGWKLFDAWLATNEEQQIKALADETDPTKMARLAGALKIIRDVRRYVPAQIEQIRRQEQKANEDAKSK